MNPLLMSDSYKLSHKFISFPGTQYIYSNLTPRFDKYFTKEYPNFDHNIVWFGLQAFIKKLLLKNGTLISLINLGKNLKKSLMMF